MSRFLLPVAAGTTLGLLLVVPASAAPPPAAPKPEEEMVEKVRKAIDKGVAFLRKEQNPQGNWEGIVLNFLADMEGGATALVTLMVNCGVTARTVSGIAGVVKEVVRPVPMIVML